MTKEGALSVGFGERRPITVVPGTTSTSYDRHELIKTFDIKYRNYIGFLWLLTQNGITIEESKTQYESNKSREVTSKEQKVIEISDEETSDNEENETTTPTNVAIPCVTHSKVKQLWIK